VSGQGQGVGKTNICITLGTYGQLFDGMDDGLAARLDDLQPPPNVPQAHVRVLEAWMP
jgi:hypothetical protein